MSSQETSSSRPASIDYGSIIGDAPDRSPNFAPKSPNIHPGNQTPGNYTPESYSRTSSHSPRSPRNEKPITITDAVHIPRWATGFVLGGRANKHLENIFRRNGDFITRVGEPTRFKQPNGQIFTVVTLIGYGSSREEHEAMNFVKRDIFGTIKKAKQMKTDGKWRETERRPRNNRRDDRYRDDRYRDDRSRDDRSR